MISIKRRIDQPILHYAEQYAKSKEIRFIGQTILLPIDYIQHHPPIHKKKSINKYTPATLEQIHCHHKTPVSLGGGDEYANLIIVHERAHRLIHATNSETISAILQTLQFEPAQLKKLNKLRKQAGNEAITFEQASKPVAD